MNTIAILTKLFPKSIAKIQQQAIDDYRESNEDNYPWPEVRQDYYEPWIDEDHDRLVWEEEQHQEYMHTLRVTADQKLAVEYPEYYQDYLVEHSKYEVPITYFDEYLEYRKQLELQEQERIAEIEASSETKRVKELSAFIGKFCGSDGLSIDLNLVEAGDRIHLHSKRGVYTVVRKRDDYVTLTAGTLNGKMFVVPAVDVKCFYDHNKTMVRKLLKS